MALSPKQVERLLKMIRQTRDAELSCPECLDELDRYTQRTLDGEPIDGILESVQAHLQACPCCAEQLRLVRETLDAIDQS